jgi:hypothetical protein
MERYKVGHVMPLREKGEHFANARIVRRFLGEHGEPMLDAEITELLPSYRGSLKMGATVTFPEGGSVGTFKNP